MANNDLTNNENIHVKVDQNNLVLIDPNSVVNDKGFVEPRGTFPEDLVMYVNLEADLVPRTTLISGNGSNTLFSIASNKFNLMKPSSKDGNLDSSWTELYTPVGDFMDNDGNVVTGEKGDSTGQSFGMSSVQIDIRGTNFIPTITIKFIDVRGKTLFESPEDSPYKAFFHIPWPVFYLTVKGFYGKAIRYRLHMVKFNSQYNDGNGNFEITTQFVGSTYAYLNDISLSAILHAPYMYAIEKVEDSKFNESTGLYEKKISKSSKGYSILQTVYEEYKRKGLIPQDFPVKTLKEVISVAKRLDILLENEIFSKVVDPKVFAGTKEFEDNLMKFEGEVNAWKTRYLSSEFTVLPVGAVDETNPASLQHYYLVKSENNKTTHILGKDVSNTLESIINVNIKKLKDSQLFTKTMLNSTGADFKKININIGNPIGGIETYYKQTQDGKFAVSINKLLTHIYDVQKSFVEQKTKLQNKVEERMNDVIKDKSKGIGFEPTIRNIFAVILAGADTYIRLMKSVHLNAFNVSEDRKSLIDGFTNESVGEAIYPWPEIKKPTVDNQKVLAYPADPDLVDKLGARDFRLWPEVEFTENYFNVATLFEDNVTKDELGFNNITYVFENNLENVELRKVSTMNVVDPYVPYTDKGLPSMLYEIYERAKYFTFTESFNERTLNELSQHEFNNLNELIKEDYYVVDILKTYVPTINDLLEKMRSFSPFERYPYYEDQIPTTQYIKGLLDVPFRLDQYSGSSDDNNVDLSEQYPKLSDNLKQYTADPHRLNIYPFNSSTYLGYIDQPTFKSDNFKFNGILKVDTTKGFITSPINPKSWVKDGVTNMFDRKINIDGSNHSGILNTPYFHKQIYNDFNNSTTHGKYAGSSFLLLNSLPFVDLDDTISFKVDNNGIEENKSILVSSLFREVGATHFIPYHLILKWGSIYHRYKKYINDGVDILSGIETPIDSSLFFDNSQTGTMNGVNHTLNKTVGLHPFYESIYHQVVNGYLGYDVSLGDSAYTNAITQKVIFNSKFKKGDVDYYSSFVDESRFSASNKLITLLPSTGGVSRTTHLYNDVPNSENFNLRSFWCYDDNVEFSLTGKTLPSYGEYFSTEDDRSFSFGNTQRKVIDLIATFSPMILDEFENAFLDFATQATNSQSEYKLYDKTTYSKFQTLLKSLSTVKKEDSYGDFSQIDSVISSLRIAQKKNHELVSDELFSENNLLKLTLGNPKELKPSVLSKYIGTSSNVSDGIYNPTQLVDNYKFINLYLGEDIDNYYQEFFVTSNIELSEENVLDYRPLIQIYGGYRVAGNPASRSTFVEYLSSNIVINGTSKGSEERLTYFLTQLLYNFHKLERSSDSNNNLGTVGNYNDSALKLETYNSFKQMNDKWISGNSIGQKLLLEEFLFLDKANADIGDKFFIDIKKLIALGDISNARQNLYSTIGIVINRSNIDLRALPSYVNFYGNNSNSRLKTKQSKSAARDIFGKFLEVDYQDSTPKMLLQYIGQTSKHLSVSSINKKYKYLNDGFNLGDTNNNPLLITNPSYFTNDKLSKSNKVVAFEINFGDQNQGLFKGITLDQSQFRNTFESNLALENLTKSEGGSGTAQIDTGLFDIYRTRSYTCEVTAMGNVMIQPTMYFQLNNVPLFEGAYWIVEVNHQIQNNQVATRFKGVRIPKDSLPDPSDSFTATYRVLYDKILKLAIAKNNQVSQSVNTYDTITTPNGTYTTDRGGVTIPGETLVKESGVTEFGIPYNGFNNVLAVQKVEYKGKTWLRSKVLEMGGKTNPIGDDTEMFLPNYLKDVVVKPSSLKWSEIKNSGKYFYSAPFDMKVLATSNKLMVGSTTTFFNPLSNLTKVNNSDIQLNSDNGTRYVNGPVDSGVRRVSDKDGNYSDFGLTLSSNMMKDLKLKDGDVVYFNID